MDFRVKVVMLDFPRTSTEPHLQCQELIVHVNVTTVECPGTAPEPYQRYQRFEGSLIISFELSGC